MEVGQALLDGLNDGQRLVATSFGHPVCVLAGAGTGKTRALTHRIAYGVHTGSYQADATIALTFTQKAAAEMAGRIRGLGVESVTARTFHSAALAQLQNFWPHLTGGLLPDILPTKGSVIAHVLEVMRISVDQAILRDLASEVEWRKVKALTVEEYADQLAGGLRRVPAGLTAEDMLEIMTRYEQAKSERGRIDLEDVLLLAVGMLESEPGVLAKVRDRYRHFLVDEYQDVSPIQQRLLDMWLGQSRDVCVVGDASQTIYTFAGATSDYLLAFASHIEDATVIRLDTNYRSTTTIVDMANRVVAGQAGALTLTAVNGVGPDIELIQADDDSAEAKGVAQRLLALHAEGVPLSEMAVLHRYSAQMVAMEQALRGANLPTHTQGGMRFFDQPHIRRAVMEIRGAAVAGVVGSVSQVVTDILYGIGYQAKEPDHHGAERGTWEDFRALISLAEGVDDGTSLRDFSEELSRRQSAHDEPNREAISLLTVHSAKGREWPVVVMMGLTEGNFPISYSVSEDAIAEEQRLFYVGVTRARERLIFSFADRPHSRASTPRTRSRFLDVL